VTPARRLTGDGAEGAFEIDDGESIQPKLWRTPVARLISDMETLAAN